jgi:hypothetical protein
MASIPGLTGNIPSQFVTSSGTLSTAKPTATAQDIAYQPGVTINSMGDPPIPAPTAPVQQTPAPAPVFTDYQGNTYGSAGAAAAANARLQADYDNLKGSTFNSITDAIGQGGNGYNSSILDYLDGRKMQVNKIDSDSVQNELSREQGHQGVLDMVGNGLKSGGVILANGNSGTSSASDALARAYAILGRQQMSSVGNQFAQGENKIQTERDNLSISDDTERRHTGEDKTNIINGIVNSARSQLAALNQQATYASLPDRVDIEGKIAEIKQQALDALSAYDATLSGGISGQPGMGRPDVQAKAHNLLVAGVAPESEFNFTSEIPMQFQDTGQFASPLPIFTGSPKKNDQ